MQHFAFALALAFGLASSHALAVDDEKSEEFDWKGEKRNRTVRTLILGGEKVAFVQIPKGSFTMGSPAQKNQEVNGENPQHTVKFTKPLWVAKFPVTKAQFGAFVKATDYKMVREKDRHEGYDGKEFVFDKKYSWKDTGWPQTDEYPVVNVTWNDAEAYVDWARKQSKKTVRLLNESEYE